MAFLKEQYSKAFAFLRGPMKKTYLRCCTWFLILCILSFGVLVLSPKTAVAIFQFFAQSIENSGMMDESGRIGAMDLFLHNAQAAGISALHGLLPFVFLPLLSLVMNGVVIGGVLAVVQITGAANVLLTVLLGLVPHGIFELPAVLMSMGLGMVICLHISGSILKRPWAIPLEELLAHAARIYLLIIVPLLAAAALVETYITPVLLGLI